MTKHTLEQRLRTAVEHAAPDCLESILSSCDQPNSASGAPAESAAGQKKGVIYMSEVNNHKTRRRPFVAAIAAVAAVLLLCVGGFGLLQQGAAPQADSIIMLDVNPSLSLTVDAAERVLAAQALNDDAKEVLGTMELEGTTLEVAVNAIIGSMLQKGYLDNAQNSILVSVENEDAARGEALQQRVSQLITSAMQTDALEAAVLSQTVSADDDTLKELAKTYNISVGKAALIQELVAKDTTLSFKALSKMTINEIALIAASRNWFSESVSQSGTASDKLYIGQAEALAIACGHAGVAEADLQRFEVEFDSDDGIMIVEVEFETAEIKCEYDLDARTGVVLKVEKKDKATAADPTKPTDQGDTQVPDYSEITSYFGEAAAKAAALAHAGVNAGDTYYITCYVGYENGKPAYYGVKFGTGSVDYEYEIDLYTGAVLDYESDRDESHTSSGSGSTSATSYIGEAAAKAAALAHAGVNASDTYYVTCYVGYENGKPAYYGVKFGSDRTDYEYKIDLYTGAVLSGEADRDDDHASSESGSGSTSYIGADAALTAALNHAGVSANDVTKKKVELDEHSNTMVYEIEFETSTKEYEYEIDAVSGAILKFESESHDNH